VSGNDTLKIPEDELVNLRRWSPNSLAGRGARAERRAANQPSAQAVDPAHVEAARMRELAVLQGLAEGRAAAQQEVAGMQAIASALQSAASEVERSFAEELMSLAIDLARHVVRTEITTNHEALLALVREVLGAAAPDASAARDLLLHPDDVELVRSHLGDDQHLGTWRIVADASVGRGGCRLVSKSRDVDATLATRWQRALQRLGRNDPLELKP
jgi:flagellar assembly protein FliH